LKLGDGIIAQVDDPGVCPFKFGLDITDDNRLAIAEIENRDCAIPSCASALRGKEQHIPVCAHFGQDSPSGDKINPSLERGHEMLDYPYTDACGAKSVDHISNHHLSGFSARLYTGFCEVSWIDSISPEGEIPKLGE